MRGSNPKEKPLPNPRLEPFLRYAKDKPRHARFIRVCLAASGWALGFLMGWVGVLVSRYVSTHFDNLVVVMLLAQNMIFAVLALTFRALSLRGARRQINSKEELRKDHRAPILYLRPFHTDPPELPAIILPFIRTAFKDLKHLFSPPPEVALAKLLRQLGPVIAVGTPGEKLPQLGAIRLYFEDKDWQEKMVALMTLSQLVVIQPGYTESLEWELSLAKARLQPYRLLFSFVAWRALRKEERQLEYEVFKVLFERIYGASFAARIGNALYVYFDHDWTPQLDYKGGYVNAILTGGLAARYGLQDLNDPW